MRNWAPFYRVHSSSVVEQTTGGGGGDEEGFHLFGCTTTSLSAVRCSSCRLSNEVSGGPSNQTINIVSSPRTRRREFFSLSFSEFSPYGPVFR